MKIIRMQVYVYTENIIFDSPCDNHGNSILGAGPVTSLFFMPMTEHMLYTVPHCTVSGSFSFIIETVAADTVYMVIVNNTFTGEASGMHTFNTSP